MANSFEVGKSYSCRSLCNADCIWTFVVNKRTPKSITVQHRAETITRRVAIDSDGREYILPFGSYSMAPVLRAK